MPTFIRNLRVNLLKKYTKHLETSYNFSLGFALSKRPHFNGANLLRVPFSSGIAVSTMFSLSYYEVQSK